MSVNKQSAPEGRWQRLDRKIFTIERLIVVAATAVMTIMVFLAVIWRLSVSSDGKIAGLLTLVVGGPRNWIPMAGELIGLIGWVLLCMFAVRTARPKLSIQWIAWGGGGIAVATLAAAKAFVWAVPHGLIFSQRLALCLLMWVVMLGSSMAAYRRRHIFLQAAEKLIPEHLVRAHAAVGLMLAAIFTFFLGWVGAQYAWSNWLSWITSEMRSGRFDSIAIPYWAVTVAFPIGFGLTGARFAGQSIGIWRGIIEARPLDDDLQAAKEQAEAQSDAPQNDTDGPKPGGAS